MSDYRPGSERVDLNCHVTDEVTDFEDLGNNR